MLILLLALLHVESLEIHYGADWALEGIVLTPQRFNVEIKWVG